MQRTQFTFYESFFKAISRIKKKQDRADAYDMICAYALYQEEPNLDTASDAVAIAFELLRPVLDKAKERAESGKRGGSKPEANDKQIESESEANAKQGEAESKKEKEEEEEKEIEIEVEKEIDNIPPTEVCGELPSSPPPAEPDPSPLSIVVIRLPLVDGTEYPFLERQVDELTALYPAVDVPQQLRNMRGWLMANPKNRKTKSGIMRFVTAWLSREQNSARAGNPTAKSGKTQLSYDYAKDPDQLAAIRRMFGGDAT